MRPNAIRRKRRLIFPAAGALLLAIPATAAALTGGLGSPPTAAVHAPSASTQRVTVKRRAARTAAHSSAQQSGGGGGWAIPSAVVQCESGGQNLPPNSAGASGYYQIIPSTWQAYGGTRYASSAYQATAQQQASVASRIWNGGGGASQWVCAGRG